MPSPSDRQTAGRPLPAPPRSVDTRPSSPLVATDLDALEPAVTFDSAIILLAGMVVGSTLAVVILPSLLPGLTETLLGDQPKAFWYLSRSSGVVAYLALWLSVVLGLTLTNRFARLWAGGPAVADLHQFSSLLSLALAIFHVVILLGDRYASYRLDELLIPFAAAQHEPFWVGLGQLGFYLALPVTFSFYLRRTIGVRAWRLIHFAAFAVFALVVAHGLGAGTDTQAPAMSAMYLVTSGSVVFLTIYRVLVASSRLAATRR